MMGKEGLRTKLLACGTGHYLQADRVGLRREDGALTRSTEEGSSYGAASHSQLDAPPSNPAKGEAFKQHAYN